MRSSASPVYDCASHGLELKRKKVKIKEVHN